MKPFSRTLRVLAAPDSFKGSLGAFEAASAMAAGVLRAEPESAVRKLPLADGGEGTMEILVRGTGGRIVPARVTGPHGFPLDAAYGVLGDGVTAIVEVAMVAGLTLFPPRKRNPLRTTSRGVGELISKALDAGYRRIILCLGGSATNDGGAGLLQALGARLVGADGTEVEATGGNLIQISYLDLAGLHPGLVSADIVAACDVDNPLLGARGASKVYGPQKGATPTMVAALEKGLCHWAHLLRAASGQDHSNMPGSGAAGGIPIALLSLARTKLVSGFDMVADAVGLEQQIIDADLVLTGEGRLDGQTLHGKVVAGVAKMAEAYGTPVVALAGAVESRADRLLKSGLTAAFALAPCPASLDEAQANARDWAKRAAEQVVRLFMAGRRAERRIAP